MHHQSLELRARLLGRGRRWERSLGAALVALASALVLPAGAFAEEGYPERDITLVLPFGPGGIADITARVVADAAGKKLGRQIVIMNQPGAGGATAARSVLNAPADGYTLALFSNGTAISVPLFKKLAFDPVKDFQPVSSLAYFDFVFVTKAGSKFTSLADVLNAARAEPGALNVGTINVGSSQNLAAELFKSTSGIDFTIVPYKATPDLLVALLGDELDVIIDSQTALKAALTQGQATAVASSGPKRSTLLPDVPTAQEQGVQGFDVTSWNAIFAPTGTPPEAVKKLNAALVEVLADPAIQKRFAELGVEARSSTPEEIGQRMADDVKKWSVVIDKAGIAKQ
jgi:tripartite-type tricarboxylate transporter receptor subunit TctC